MLATTAVAQVSSNLPPIPAPAAAAPAAPQVTPPPDTQSTTTNAPAKKATKAKKHTVKKKKATTSTADKKPAESAASTGPVTLVAGPATVASEHVNLRGQAGLKGEVVGHAKKGDSITVISEITLDKPKAGEPAQWAKIALPSDTKVWIDSKYVDTTNNTVNSKKLNLRGGPGENFSVLGVIEKGASVTPVTTKGDWMQIQPPASAFAFVAASYLKQEAGAAATPPPALASTENVPPPAPALPPPTPTTVPEPAPIAPPTAVPPPATETAPVVPPPAIPAPATGLLPPPTLANDNDTNSSDTNLPPPPPRIVTHEGSVRHSASPVAPTYFELYNIYTDKAIDYLFSSSTNLNLARYDGLHITVTGEEAMDPRWKDTPVLTIQKIYVLPPEKLNTVINRTPMGGKH